MTVPVRIDWPIEVARLPVDPALVGQTVELGTHSGVRIVLFFPTEVEAQLGGGPPYAAGRVTMTDATGKPLTITYGRLGLIAALTTEMDTLAGATPDHVPNQAEEEEVKRIRVEAGQAAEMALRRFVELLANQEKLVVLTIERPPLQHLGRLSIGAPPVAIQWGRDPLHITSYGGGVGLPASAIEQAAKRVAAGEEPRLYWQIYREAFRRLFLDEDPRPATVEAATAVEVGIKAGLRRKDKSEVVQLLTDTPRVEMLLKAGAKAVFGDSYANADPPNYKLVHDLLLQRHGLVHVGQPPDVAALKKQLPAIRSLLEWIDRNSP